MPRVNAARDDLRATGAGLDRRRDELLDAATRLFAERGYHGTTIEDVVATAGVAKGTVYWYYRSKKALFLAVLERIAGAFRDELARRLTDVSSPLERLQIAVDGVARLAGKRPDLYRLYFQQVFDADDVFVAERAKISERIRAELAGVLDEAIRRKEIPKQDPQLLSRMIIGAVEAATGHGAETISADALASTLTAFVLGGLKGASAGAKRRT